MMSHGIRRKIVVRLPSFLGAARIVAQTEFIATVPDRFGAVMATQERIRLFALPINLPSSDVKLHRSEEHTSELQSLMRLSYAVFCLKKKTTHKHLRVQT